MSRAAEGQVTLYDRDFYEWTREQAAALRRRLSERANTDLDLENLAEEVESLGNRDRRAVDSTLTRIIEHLLKLEYSPAQSPRNGWMNSVLKQRDRLEIILADSPSLRATLDLDKAYAKARRYALTSLGNDRVPENRIPMMCPYTLAQIEDEDFWPERHGRRVPDSGQT